MTQTIELYSSIECPFAYLAVHRLRQVWPEFAGRITIIWRALSLEYINRQVTPKPGNDFERSFLRQVDPSLPAQPWARPEWTWPGTFWPAAEALACAQAQSTKAAFELSWRLRYAFFWESRTISLRQEIFALARTLPAEILDFERFDADWDGGRYKSRVLSESQHGWHELKVDGSPTFVLPDGSQISSPATGEIDIDEEKGILRSYKPFDGDPLGAIREMLKQTGSMKS
jgi:predicted DsbA family dithiol-disulfide isomerase